MLRWTVKYVREVKVADPAMVSQAHLAQVAPASASAPALARTQSDVHAAGGGTLRPPSKWDGTISQRIALVGPLTLSYSFWLVSS